MGHTSAIDSFLHSHKAQLVSSGVPEHFWEPLYKKLISQSFDAGRFFQLIKFEERESHEPLWGLQALRDISKSDSEKIFLIDHAWTYAATEAKSQLYKMEHLRFRVSDMLGIDKTLPTDELVDKIFDNMWKINNCYSIQSTDGGDQDQIPLWYIMDEVGCAVAHSDQPNCRVVPFIYLTQGITYSLLFPIDDIEESEILYRDFAEGVQDPAVRKALLLPWVPNSFEDVTSKPTIPGPDYYLSGHIPETLPDYAKLTNNPYPKKDKYLVYSQYSLVRKYLNDAKFELTEDEDAADILWYTEHFRDFKILSESPEKFVNQFPYEYVITVKDLLCLTCRRYKNNTETAEWFPVTYNLVTEINNFVSYFQNREKHCLENYWIVKPYNLARGMDIHITNNLNYIMRLPATGPKIAQKYITNPVLFYRPECDGKVKFDVRYVILLKSVKPLEVYVYKKFFLRFANKPFELNNFEDYEKHFTVMNYTENVTLKHIKCEEFKTEWEKQYSNYVWDEVETKILKMIKDILECAVSVEQPCGIAESPQSRALYAADLMLDWQKNNEIQPKILEINFMPDCERACKYYPDFYNDIFKLMFLGQESEVFFKL